MTKELLSFDAISRKNVQTGDAFALRATDIHSSGSQSIDRVLTGKIDHWQATETYNPGDEDFWIAWFDPSIYWKIDDTGVHNDTSWLWKRHEPTSFEDPNEYPPGIQTNGAERVTLVVPCPAFQSGEHWRYQPGPAGYITGLEIRTSDPHRLLKNDETAPEDDEVNYV